MGFVISLVSTFFWVLTLLVIIKVVLSYFMSPYHQVRQFVDQIVEPMLAPIRRILPSTGMLDFSPIVLLIILQIVEAIIINLLRTL